MLVSHETTLLLKYQHITQGVWSQSRSRGRWTSAGSCANLSYQARFLKSSPFSCSFASCRPAAWAHKAKEVARHHLRECSRQCISTARGQGAESRGHGCEGRGRIRGHAGPATYCCRSRPVRPPFHISLMFGLQLRHCDSQRPCSRVASFCQAIPVLACNQLMCLECAEIFQECSSWGSERASRG